MPREVYPASLVWCDTEITAQQNKHNIVEIQKVCNAINFTYCTTVDEARHLIESTSTAVLIMSGKVATILVPQICGALKQNNTVHSIIVFCEQVEVHKEWTQQYKKVKLVSKNITEVVDTAKMLTEQALSQK